MADLCRKEKVQGRCYGSCYLFLFSFLGPSSVFGVNANPQTVHPGLDKQRFLSWGPAEVSGGQSEQASIGTKFLCLFVCLPSTPNCFKYSSQTAKSGCLKQSDLANRPSHPPGLHLHTCRAECQSLEKSQQVTSWRKMTRLVYLNFDNKVPVLFHQN